MPARPTKQLRRAPSGLMIHPDHVPEPAEQPKPGVGETPVLAAGRSPSPGTTVATPEPEPDHLRLTDFDAQFGLDPVRCIKQPGEIADHVRKQARRFCSPSQERRGFDDSTRRTVSKKAHSLGAQSSELE